MTHPLARWGMGVAATVVLLLALGLAALWWGQERLLFAPQVLPANHRFDLHADVQETWIDVPGARLNALHLRLPQPRGIVFFLHGNGGSLQNWFVNVDFYRRANMDLYMIDYRGYGKSSGRITSEAQLHADVRAAWDQVAPMYEGKRRVIYGRSLGSGLAAALAANVQSDLTVLVSAYQSMVALGADHYPWVPAWISRYPLRTDLLLPGVKSPLLLVHGARDTLIRPEHSRRLQALVPSARLVLVPEAAHNDLQNFDSYLKLFDAALK